MKEPTAEEEEYCRKYVAPYFENLPKMKIKEALNNNCLFTLLAIQNKLPKEAIDPMRKWNVFYQKKLEDGPNLPGMYLVEEVTKSNRKRIKLGHGQNIKKRIQNVRENAGIDCVIKQVLIGATLKEERKIQKSILLRPFKVRRDKKGEWYWNEPEFLEIVKNIQIRGVSYTPVDNLRMAVF